MGHLSDVQHSTLNNDDSVTQDCIVTYSYIRQGPSVPTAHDGIAIVARFCISTLLCIVIVTWYCRPESMVILLWDRLTLHDW